jgi:hypothetical protein
MLLKTLATSKMKEVHNISADFQGTSLVFTLLFSVFFDRGKNAEFLGIYQLSDSIENVESSAPVLPTLCFKRALWDLTRDSQLYHNAGYKRAYVEGKEQIVSRLLFVPGNAYPDINDLLHSIRQVVYQGITLTRAPSSLLAQQDISIQLREDVVSLSFTYGTFTHSNSALENLLLRFQ